MAYDDYKLQSPPERGSDDDHAVADFYEVDVADVTDRMRQNFDADSYEAAMCDAADRRNDR